MRDEQVSTLTERGQTSVPAAIRRLAKLKPGHKLIWEQISATEFRITLADSEDVPGPKAMLGYARKLRPADTRTTDQIMAELRAGDED